MREVAFHRTQPASIRLVDNLQFRFGNALKPGTTGLWQPFMDKAQRYYVTKIKGFAPEELCAATLVFEGDRSTVDIQKQKVYAIAKKHGGLKASAENGKRGYQLTFMIAYLRDLAFQAGVMGESFETSIPWSNVLSMCRRVKERIRRVLLYYFILISRNVEHSR